MSSERLYIAISDLSALAKKQIAQQEFEQLNQTLAERLELLKKLDADVTTLAKASPDKQAILSEYSQFLVAIKASDEKDMSTIAEARKSALDSTAKQSKITQAVSAYKSVTKY